MALDLNATPKDYRLIIYNKDEIDLYNTTEQARVNSELDLKSLKSDEGAPSGIATLDATGKLKAVEMPIATNEESNDDTNSTTIITPATLAYQMVVKAVTQSQIGEADGIAPLNSLGLVPTENLPAIQHVQTFVVDTLADLYSIGTALEGDRGVVTSEPSFTTTAGDHNGEYVAKINYPVDSSGWEQLPNIASVSSVNGSTGSVLITSINESAANASRLDTIESELNTATTGVLSRLTTAESDVSTNASDIAENVTAIGLKADQSSLDTTNGVVSGHTTAISLKADQSALDTTNSNVLVNTNYRIARTYEHANTANFTVANDAYEEVNRLTTTSLPAGTYQLTLSMIYTINSVTSAAYFRFSIDGGNTWVEVRKESKDISDKLNETYITVDNFAGGIKDVVVQARKETAGDTLIVLDQSIIYERKGA